MNLFLVNIIQECITKCQLYVCHVGVIFQQCITLYFIYDVCILDFFHTSYTLNLILLI
jgi:hypothetical protein